MNKLQQIYSDVLQREHEHFIVDDEPFSIFNGACEYSGTGCAIGILVDDDVLKARWDNERLTVGEPPVYRDVGERVFGRLWPVEKPENSEQIAFLEDLQAAHDEFAPRGDNGKTDFEAQLEAMHRLFADAPAPWLKGGTR